MLTGLLHAHSGLRYLVLLAGALALAWALYGVLAKRPYDRPMKILASSFAGLLHLQVLLGFVLLVSGVFRTHLITHLGMMLMAAVVAQIPLSVFRRRAPDERSHGPHLVSIAVSLGLIWLGIRSLGLGLLGSHAF